MRTSFLIFARAVVLCNARTGGRCRRPVSTTKKNATVPRAEMYPPNHKMASNRKRRLGSVRAYCPSGYEQPADQSDDPANAAPHNIALS